MNNEIQAAKNAWHEAIIICNEKVAEIYAEVFEPYRLKNEKNRALYEIQVAALPENADRTLLNKKYFSDVNEPTAPETAKADAKYKKFSAIVDAAHKKYIALLK